MAASSARLTLSLRRPTTVTPVGGEGTVSVLFARTAATLASQAGIILMTKAG